MGRVCALESAHYLRNQLLRDADWAGMAHSIEIRTPLVDIALLRNLATSIPSLTAKAGKKALAEAPQLPVPDTVLRRAKSGFGVPTGAWIDDRTRRNPRTARSRVKGLASRDWSRIVLAAFAKGGEAMIPA